MPGLPGALIGKLTQTLLDCGPFQSDAELVSVFSDERIRPWKNQISSASRPLNRVRLFVSDFLERKNRQGQNVLVLFLQALHDQTDAEDDCRQRLDDVAIETAAALSPNLPPMAANNLWRSSAMQKGQDLPENMGGYGIASFETDARGQTDRLPPELPARIFAEKLESLKNMERADWLPVSFLEKGLLAAGAVGRVEHELNKIGTAFLLAPDLVLTNAHVVRDIPDLQQGKVRFMTGLQGEPYVCYFAKVLAQSPVTELDFALVQLVNPAAGRPLHISNETAYPDQAANILQYPQGQSLQVALRRNEVVYVETQRLYYVTDTAPCSSGSPVFNDEWSVIALHRAGIVDDAQRAVKNANQGVPITAIEPLIRPYLPQGS